MELLSRADFELFAWEEEDLRDSDPLQVKTIGAPLETAKKFYLDLQTSYYYIIQDKHYNEIRIWHVEGLKADNGY